MIIGEPGPMFNFSGGTALMCMILGYPVFWSIDELHGFFDRKVLYAYGITVVLFYGQCVFAGIEAFYILEGPDELAFAVSTGSIALSAIPAAMLALCILILKRQRRYDPAQRWYKHQ